MRIDRPLSLIFGVPAAGFYADFSESEAFVAEQRPALEGIRVVGPALLKRGTRPVILCDNMMAYCMERGLVKDVRIFADSLDKERAVCRAGSLIAALAAAEHKIPVYLYDRAGLASTCSLLTIAGHPVTEKGLATYVPLAEEVPVTLLKEIRHG